MLEFFNRPYLFNNNLKHNIKIILAIGLGLFFFLQFFQPFGLDVITEDKKIYIIAGFGVITGMVLTLNLLIIPAVIPSLFKEAKWKIKKEIIWNIWILITLCVSYFFFSYYSEWFNMNFAGIFKISLLSTIPISVLIAINRERSLKMNLKSALELNKRLLRKENEEKIVKIEKINLASESGKVKIEIELDKLLFVRSANNYVEVYWKEEDQVQKSLLRSSLLRIEENLKKYPNIFKCHRTCLINIINIDRVSGNSQGYKLVFENVMEEIPVSRLYAKELLALMQKV